MFESENDYNVAIKGLRFALRLARTESMKDVVDIKSHSTDQNDLFWPGDADPDQVRASFSGRSSTVTISVFQITDDELKAFIRDHGLTIFHPVSHPCFHSSFPLE